MLKSYLALIFLRFGKRLGMIIVSASVGKVSYHRIQWLASARFGFWRTSSNDRSLPLRDCDAMLARIRNARDQEQDIIVEQKEQNHY